MNEGKKDRRDPIRTVKPRNFVAKNASATTSGAGAHKDKKRAEKNGDTKHKKAEYAESLAHMLESALRDKADYTEKRKALDDLSKNKDVDQKAVQQRRVDLDKEAKKKGVAEGSDKYDHEAKMAKGELLQIAKNAMAIFQMIDEGDNLDGWVASYITVANDHLNSVQEQMEGDDAQGISEEQKPTGWGEFPPKQEIKIVPTRKLKSGETHQDRNKYWQSQGQSPIYKANEGEGDAEGLPELTVELAKDIRDQIGTEGPHAICKSVEWGDGAADDLVVLIKNALDDYIEANVHEGYQESSINEIKKGAKDSNGVSSCWTGYHASGTKKGKNGGQVRNCVKNEDVEEGASAAAVRGAIAIAKKESGKYTKDGKRKKNEGWTHDSLAAELFETENTYEDKLANLLNKRLGK